MTISHHAAAVSAEDVGEAVRALRCQGLRVTASRRLLLEALFLAPGPVTAEQIAAGLDGEVPPSDLASVYRNLEVFEKLGLVRHVHLGHGPGLYALAGRGGREYLVCEACDRVQAVEPAALERVRALIRADFGYEARFGHFPIVGLCPDCVAGVAMPDTKGDRA